MHTATGLEGTDEQPARAAERPAALGRLARWLPLLAVLTVLVAVLVALDTSWWDVARYATYAVWAVLLPGVLVYRALRRTPHSLVDDLAMGAALGLALELVAYVTFSATGLRSMLWLWPLVVAVPFAALRPLRRHWRPAGYRRPSLAWCWTVAATATYLLGYLTFAFLRPNRPVPITGGQSYFIDELYQLSLVGEAKHHFPLQTPQVAGEPLTYHWFAFAHMASASMISGVDTPVVFFRLALPAMCLLAVVLLAVVGWRVSGRAWVGAVASALGLVVGELALGSHALTSLGGTTAYTVWSSESVPYGWLMTFPMIALIIDRLVGGLPGAPMGRGAWWGLALFAAVGSGAKASVLPVTLTAVGMVALVELVRRRPTRPVWMVIAILCAAFLTAVAVLYRFEPQGMSLRPLGMFHPYVSMAHLRPAWKVAAGYGFVFVAYCLFMFTRLVGIPVLARIRGRSWGTVEWFLLGGAVGGALGTLLLAHPQSGQNYFVRSGFAFGAILSAMGLVALVEKHRVPGRTMIRITVAVVAVVWVPSLVFWQLVQYQPVGIRVMLPIYYGALIPAAIVAVVLVAGWRRWRGLAGVTALMLALGAGLPTLVWDAHFFPNANNYYHSALAPQEVAGARWLRDHSGPDDVVATNVHCVNQPAAGACWNVSYWMSAFAERRFLIESWGYAPRTLRTGLQRQVFVGLLPFWDRELLATNDAAFAAPDRQILAALWDRGVRWLIVDRRFSRESDTLRDLADIDYDNGTTAVYRLRHP